MTKRGADRVIRSRILLAGIGARRGAAALLFLVAVIGVAAAAIGPMFLQSADTSVLTSTARATTVGQTDLLVITNGGVKEMKRLRAAAARAENLGGRLLAPALFTADVGAHFATKGQGKICQRLKFLSGSCPTAINNVAISERSAALAGVRLGDHLQITEPRTAQSLEVTVSGIYLPPSTYDDYYWKDLQYFTYGSGSPPSIVLDPLVASFATTLGASRLAEPQLSADLAWRNTATFSGASKIESTSRSVTSQLFQRYGLSVSPGLTSVIKAARHDDELMSAVVLAIVLQLILLTLLILYSLGRSTIVGRRQESEFARRHGFPRSAMITLAIGEPVALIIAAFPIGVVLAWGTLEVITHTIFVPGTPVALPLVALATAAGACVAGVVAMAVASSDLWRSRASNARQARIVNIAVDTFAVSLALIGLLLVLTQGPAGASRADSLTLLAPGILTLGVAIIALRAADLVIKFFIGRTGETNRVATFLALRQIGRRPTTLRRLLPLTVATAVMLFAVSSFFLASSNRTVVADFNVGAARVVNVTPPPGLNFEEAVRRADPSGREAMAAINYSSPSGELFGVDASRLAAVSYWSHSLSPVSLAALARKLSPPLLNGVSFTGRELRLTVKTPAGTPPIELGVNLFDQTYRTSPSFYVGPVFSGVHSFTFSLSGCADLCRLSGLSPSWEDSDTQNVPSVRFALEGVAVMSGGRWHHVGFGAAQRGTWSAQPASVRVETFSSSVAFDIPGRFLLFGGLVLSPIDAPAVTPAIVTSNAEITDVTPTPSTQRNVAIDLSGGLFLAHPVAVVPTLPLLGLNGVLVALNLAERSTDTISNPVTYQVWLAPSASPRILRRLQADGITVGSSTSASHRLGVLDHAGVALAYAVAVIAAPIAALLALGTVAFSIVSDGRRRRRERAWLSMAGVSTRTIRRAEFLESTLALGIALLLGIAIGFAADSLALSSLPQFVKATRGIPISGSVPTVPFFVAAGVFAALVVLGVALSTRVTMRTGSPRRDRGWTQ
jgi:putative ABC transport system permease protein